ncbi:NADH dehydrogenase [Natronolimnohabitans innermongolicus]|uniref:Respiratory-chain NADH dehydrogenase domain 51 kDa subunit n=1 Tax=Natronolimnohabitans innermongolicus JCM 12255 TaxID=1227499 RepID=L9XFX2_9EURY|nr:NADH dehydrogenase [Natronolimnohabitans innermongolicus]ELY59573.1 respiratory-chain NADH dehydrogenase domain 51 kDa subunit [Natronolimnohabitans innermongolicus JCM 12255]
MSATRETIRAVEQPEFATTLRTAGLAGAGGAGFPTYAKWDRLAEVDSLLVNHQESEPNYYMDKWLGRERVDELVGLFDGLLDAAFDRIVIGAKRTDREEWLPELEAATGATIYEPDDLPVADDETGIVIAYTDDRYEYGMESVLLRLVANVVIGGDDLPMDHGWLVQNTETLYNVYRALVEGEPMTTKFVHVDGRVPTHRFLEVPIGTPATDLLEAAGRTDGLDDNEVILDGGPGWCFEIADSPDRFGVRKRTNGLLVMEESVVAENRLGSGGRVNVLAPAAWKQSVHETEPTAGLRPDRVEVPLITNPDFDGIVTPSEPIVRVGDAVEIGEMVARPTDGISIAQHAPIAGTIVRAGNGSITIDRTADEETT